VKEGKTRHDQPFPISHPWHGTSTVASFSYGACFSARCPLVTRRAFPDEFSAYGDFESIPCPQKRKPSGPSFCDPVSRKGINDSIEGQDEMIEKERRSLRRVQLWIGNSGKKKLTLGYIISQMDPTKKENLFHFLRTLRPLIKIRIAFILISYF